MDDTQTAQRDAKGRWLAPPPGNRAITSDTAHDMLRLRAAKRARLATAGAMRAVQDAELIVKYGEDAALVERAQTLQQLASTVEGGKATVMAAQYLDKLQGYVADDPTTAAVDSVSGLVRELARLVAVVMPAEGGRADEGTEEEANGGVVDGLVDG